MQAHAGSGVGAGSGAGGGAGGALNVASIVTARHICRPPMGKFDDSGRLVDTARRVAEKREQSRFCEPACSPHAAAVGAEATALKAFLVPSSNKPGAGEHDFPCYNTITMY
jgi:hypothetical protein